MIFYIKMGKNFQSKAQMVAGGHMIASSPYITYSPVVSRDRVRTAEIIAALNVFSTLGCDIQNSYLTATCREKIWKTDRPEFGSEAVNSILVVRALYGLKFSGASFGSFLAETLYDLR